jgi:alkaline phosphatase
MEDTLTFDEAVLKATEITDDEDTLIIVVADHAHPFTMGSWTSLNTPILGKQQLDLTEYTK